MPVVAVGRYELDIPHVAVDDVAAAECAVSHLVCARSPAHRLSRRSPQLDDGAGPLHRLRRRPHARRRATRRAARDPDAAHARRGLAGDRASGRRRARRSRPSSRPPTRSPSGRSRRCASRPPHAARRQRGGLRRRRACRPTAIRRSPPSACRRGSSASRRGTCSRPARALPGASASACRSSSWCVARRRPPSRAATSEPVAIDGRRGSAGSAAVVVSRNERPPVSID